ncbi:MAG: hypothetical protein ACFE9Q_08855 [Candidatus Hodarchaeota archaeon]
MPVGLVVMRWNERVGTEMLAKYPEEINVTDKTLMQVYSTHEYSEESGMISMMVGSLNIVSYFSGPDKGLYILLLLSSDDDPESYEEGLIDISRIILQNLVDNSYISMIPSLFRRLSVYPTLNSEQNLAITYQDEIKRMILNRLRDEGVVSKSELIIWLKDRYKQDFVDLEEVLNELIKLEIVKETTVQDMSSEFIFLIKDVVALRIPPVKIVDDPIRCGLPSQLVEKYIIEVKNFFQTYHPSDGDTLRIIDILINPQVYEILRLLRKSIVTKNNLQKLRIKGVDDLDEVLKMLWETKMIQVFQDYKNNEYIALISDFYLDLMFPKYLLNIIKNIYDQKSKSNRVLVEYLTILENSYTDIKAATRAEAKSKM